MAPFILGLLKAGLPLLANAALTQGKDWVKEKTGVDLGDAGESLTPEQLTQLKQFELENERELRAFMLENARIEAANTDSARKLQIAALAQDDPFAKRFIYYLATFWSLMAAVYIGWITFGTIPPDNIRFADTILGFLLGTVVATLLNYFFGSSKSSKEKDGVVQSLAGKLESQK